MIVISSELSWENVSRVLTGISFTWIQKLLRYSMHSIGLNRLKLFVMRSQWGRLLSRIVSQAQTKFIKAEKFPLNMNVFHFSDGSTEWSTKYCIFRDPISLFIYAYQLKISTGPRK